MKTILAAAALALLASPSVASPPHVNENGWFLCATGRAPVDWQFDDYCAEFISGNNGGGGVLPLQSIPSSGGGQNGGQVGGGNNSWETPAPPGGWPASPPVIQCNSIIHGEETVCHTNNKGVQICHQRQTSSCG